MKILGVGEKLPVRSRSIDRVISAFALRNLSDRSGTFLEIYRVLTHGGIGTVIEFSPTESNSVWNPMTIYIKFLLPLFGGILANDLDAYRYLSRTILAFAPPEALVAELTRTGFSNIRSKRLIGGVAVLYTFQKSDG